MMVRFRLARVLRVAIATMVLASLALSVDRSAGNATTVPHVLTISDAGDVSTLNPHLAQSAAVANLSEMTMAWLVRWDKYNQPYPELATEIPSQANGGVSPDGRTIVYHIRKGVRWSDGAPFDADDVVFSTKVVNDPANDEGGRLDQIASVEEPDKFTVVYHLKKPYASFIEAFFSSCCANPSLLPKHILSRYPNINNAPYNALPIGIGPFRFERWDRGEQVVMVADPLYWRGRPKLDKVIYKIVPDRTKLMQELTAHTVDMWYQFGGAYLAPITQLGSYTILRHPSYAYDHLDFNLTHPAVSDLAVRRALRLALDRRALVETVAHGVGVVQDTAAPQTAPYYADLGTTPHDAVAANAILDRAGWKRGSDGIRGKAGVRLDLAFAISSGQPDTDARVAVVRANWKNIGVDLHVDRYPPAQMFASAQQGGIIYGDAWDVVLFAFAADPLGDFSGNLGCAAFPPEGQNDLHWCNHKAQMAMDSLTGHYLQSQRTDDVTALMREFIRDTPSIVLALREDLFAFDKSLKNYDPNNITPFDNMMDVDI